MRVPGAQADINIRVDNALFVEFFDECYTSSIGNSDIEEILFHTCSHLLEFSDVQGAIVNAMDNSIYLQDNHQVCLYEDIPSITDEMVDVVKDLRLRLKPFVNTWRVVGVEVQPYGESFSIQLQTKPLFHPPATKR